MKWEHVALGDVAEFIRGITYKPTDLVENFSSGSIVCMRTANIQATLDESDLLSIPRALVKNDAKVLRQGDLLVSTANSWNLVGKCCWVPALSFGATVGGFIAALRGEATRIDSRFLYRWFSSPRTQANVRNCGRQTTNISNLDIGRCLDLDLLLPPLAEQRRIAAMLDTADMLRQKRQATMAKLDEFVQALFLDMFGHPVANTMGWPIVRLGDVAESRLGKMLDKRTSQGAHMKPYLANLNVQWGRFELGSLRRMNFDPSEQIEFSLRDGDILMCEGGEPGRCAIWKGQHADIYYQKALHRIRCNEDSCSPEYIQRLFFTLAKTGAFRSSVASATIAHLPGIKLKQIQIPLPPIDHQRKYATIVKKVAELSSVQAKALLASDHMFESLQQRAFVGAA